MQTVTKEWLQQKLKERGRGSQKELADHLGVEPTAISKIVKGTREVQAREIAPILEFFDASPAQILELRKLEAKLDEKGVQELLAFARYLHQKQETERTAQPSTEGQD